MNLQTLSLGNTEALARRTGRTVDLTSKVEGMSQSMLNSVMKIPPVKPPKPIPEVNKTNEAIMYDAFKIEEAQAQIKVLEEGQALLSGLNSGVQLVG